MTLVAKTAGLISLAALLSMGCAVHLQSRGVLGGGPQLSFWPPPEATWTWSGHREAAPGPGLGEAADRLAAGLRAAGYTDLRWYAIGSRYAHGFVVTTRLERVRDDGAPGDEERRWSPRFPEASNLLWLEGARRTRLPGEGRYRVLLVAFTDLPIGATSLAQRRSDQTWMVERPEAPSAELSPQRRVSADYRVGVYEYDYEAGPLDGEGAFVSAEEAPPATAQSPVLPALLGAPP
jgi:hypothetical protein